MGGCQTFWSHCAWIVAVGGLTTDMEAIRSSDALLWWGIGSSGAKDFQLSFLAALTSLLSCHLCFFTATWVSRRWFGRLDGELDVSDMVWTLSKRPKKSYKYDLANLLVSLIAFVTDHQNHHSKWPKWGHVRYRRWCQPNLFNGNGQIQGSWQIYISWNCLLRLHSASWVYTILCLQCWLVLSDNAEIFILTCRYKFHTMSSTFLIWNRCEYLLYYLFFFLLQ